ncbi:MAG: hypothetical protein M1281_14190 [Chloroflexi bacterium]|nr:hypothetical protein [Chloroflexota bacterium]
MSAAIWAENTHSNGIAFWAQNNSLASTAQMQNLGSGPALQAQNSGTSSTVSVKNLSSGTALQVENSGSASTAEITNLGTGAAFSVENNGTSATLSVKNQGSGPLIQAYNGAETPDQFRVGNDGSIASQADTYVFIPGSAFVKQESIDSTTWKMMGDGSAQIASGSSYLIPKVINYPITLPSMLYGHPVEVKSLTIYYKCLDGAKGWISETQLQLGPMIDSVLIMGQDFNDHKSTSWTSYTIPISINNLLTNDQGILGLHLHLSFVDATSYVQIGGIRLQLGTYRSE